MAEEKDDASQNHHSSWLDYYSAETKKAGFLSDKSKNPWDDVDLVAFNYEGSVKDFGSWIDRSPENFVLAPAREETSISCTSASGWKESLF